MSLEVDGIWKSGVWAFTVWADGVWREGEFISQVLQGNKMFADYIKTQMTVDGEIVIMTPSFNKRDMIV